MRNKLSDNNKKVKWSQYISYKLRILFFIDPCKTHFLSAVFFHTVKISHKKSTSKFSKSVVGPERVNVLFLPPLCKALYF